ncbi:RIC1-domain-containing protein [Dunaliella salina]|uniref:RIC1-domain-containing protein n=1 Tax=Dunaliella salina TaxID=3046 RepID=A0ABQ7G1C3_DUNSA|nr:RIC1-domain-containing protein [Dunaliella salina]|eukprot:KAF5828400.1 RIC1-domain-containing protein [Dunaliella salina]
MSTGSSNLLQPFAAPPPPSFHPVPESQPVLPCLLRRLLQAGPHFSRSLEWLLFTALENQPSSKKKEASALLSAAANLVRQFPSLFSECVLAVARKTDAQLWPALFSAVGPPSALMEDLLEMGALASAACFLLVIDRVEGASIAHAHGLRLVRLALKRAHYPLVAELLRFIVYPVELDPAGSSGKQVEGNGCITVLGNGGAAASSGVDEGSSGRSSKGGAGGTSSLAAKAGVGPAADAWQMVAAEAWALLWSGRLRSLVALADGLAFTPEGLPGLMRAHRPDPSSAPSPGSGEVTSLELLSILRMVAHEYPLWHCPSLELEARTALEVAQAVNTTAWVVPLAVMLASHAEVQPFIGSKPQVWRDLVELVKGDEKRIHAITTKLEHSSHPIHFYKVKAHSGIVGNEGANACARIAALSDTIDIAFPDARDPFQNFYWLSLETSSS